MPLISQDGSVLPLETAYDFLEAVRRVDPPRGCRKGQFAFNLLLDYRPDLAEAIRGTAIDPFHALDVSAEFREHITVNW